MHWFEVSDYNLQIPDVPRALWVVKMGQRIGQRAVIMYFLAAVMIVAFSSHPTHLISPSDFYIFSNMKKLLGFASDDDAISAMHSQEKNLCKTGIKSFQH